MGKFNWAKETDNQYKYMYPNNDYYQTITTLNKKQAKTLIVLFAVSIFAFFTVLIVLVALPEDVPINIVIIINSSLALLFVCVWTADILCFYKKKNDIRRKQLNELTADETKWQNQISLHKLVRKYNKKWNIVHTIELILIFAYAITVGISSAANPDADVLMSIMFSIVIFCGPPLIVTLIINLNDYKKLRQQAHVIENLIPPDFL